MYLTLKLDIMEILKRKSLANFFGKINKTKMRKEQTRDTIQMLKKREKDPKLPTNDLVNIFLILFLVIFQPLSKF